MTQIQNSHEREVDDWAALFHAADSRFTFLGAEQPAGSNLWFVVAEWKEQLRCPGFLTVSLPVRGIRGLI